TAFFGEYLGGVDIGARDFVPSWAGAGAMAAAWDLPTGGGANGQGWWDFSSKHQVVQFCFGDGSVRAVKKSGTTNWFSPRWYAFNYMCGGFDGQVVNWSQIGG